jgi:hypothetical protein
MTSRKHLLVAIVATSLALAGCASTGPQLPERVLIPVAAECPVPDIPAQPTPPAALHDKSAPDAEKARALAVYIDQLTGHIDALTALLRGYQPNTHK